MEPETCSPAKGKDADEDQHVPDPSTGDKADQDQQNITNVEKEWTRLFPEVAASKKEGEEPKIEEKTLTEKQPDETRMWKQKYEDLVKLLQDEKERRRELEKQFKELRKRLSSSDTATASTSFEGKHTPEMSSMTLSKSSGDSSGTLDSSSGPSQPKKAMPSSDTAIASTSLDRFLALERPSLNLSENSDDTSDTRDRISGPSQPKKAKRPSLNLSENSDDDTSDTRDRISGPSQTKKAKVSSMTSSNNSSDNRDNSDSSSGPSQTFKSASEVGTQYGTMATNFEFLDIKDAADRGTFLGKLYMQELEKRNNLNNETYRKNIADVEEMRKDEKDQDKVNELNNKNEAVYKFNKTKLTKIKKNILRTSELITQLKCEPVIRANLKGMQVFASTQSLLHNFKSDQTVEYSKLEACSQQINSSTEIEIETRKIKDNTRLLDAIGKTPQKVLKLVKNLESRVYNTTIKTLNIPSEQQQKLSVKKSKFTSKLLKPSVGESLNIQTEMDINKRCWAPGILEISETEFILTDWNNSCLKWLDLDSKTTWRCSLQSKPWGITIIPESRIAVTFPDAEQISYFKTDRADQDRDMCTKIPARGRCLDIHSSGDKLFVTYISPQPKIQILDLTGQVIQVIQRERDTSVDLFDWQIHCAVRQDGKRLYVTDSAKHTLTCLDTTDTCKNVHWTYTDKQLKYPTGVVTGFGDCIYVCGTIHNKKTIHVVSHHGLRLAAFILNNIELRNLLAICYSIHHQALYVTSDNFVTVLPLMREN